MDDTLFQENNPRRQKLIQPLDAVKPQEKADPLVLKNTKSGGVKLKMAPIDVKNYIRNLDDLKECLLLAMKLELSTIPPYLCGLYTIKEGSNVEAAALIRSVLVEEMLHMVLVANILNAISDPKSIQKGEKLFNVKDIIADYPTPLPGNIVPEMPKGMPPFQVGLLKFSLQALQEFCIIERPSDPNAPINCDATFDGIGQFYQAIRYGLERLNEESNGALFIGDPKRQVGPEHYYGSGGKIVKVHSYSDAEQAIAEIVGQGEGIDGTIKADEPMFGDNIEYAHYFKFQEICHGRMYSANDTNFQMPVKSVPTGRSFPITWSSVYNMKANPKLEDYKNYPELLQKAIDFNTTYIALLDGINDAVSGQPDLLIKGITVMYDLKYKALELLNIPIGNGECAGPTFEYVEKQTPNV